MLSILPTFAHHLLNGIEAPLGGVDHIGAFCAAAIRLLLTPVHGAFHLALAIGLAFGLWDRFAAWRSLQTVLRSLHSQPPCRNGPLWHAAQRSKIEPERLHVVSGLANPAFTAGLWSPQIYVSSSLELRLSQGELNCVIAHEAAHVARRDPLRLSAYRFLSCLLFWLPAFKGLAADIADEAEIQADATAADDAPLVLASAILKLAAEPASMSLPRSVVRFSNPDLLNRRIRRLAGEDTSLPCRVSRGSITFATFAAFLVLISGLAAAQTPPGVTADNNHCRHHHGSLWSHIWCSPRDCDRQSGHCEHSR